MKNLRFGYFFAIVILVLNVWGYPYVQLNQDSTACLSEVSEATEVVVPLVNQNNLAFISNTPLSDFDKTFNVDLIESEIEEELISSKKHIAGSAYIAAILCFLLLSFFFSQTAKYAVFARRFSNLTFHHRYILYQVFRI